MSLVVSTIKNEIKTESKDLIYKLNREINNLRKQIDELNIIKRENEYLKTKVSVLKEQLSLLKKKIFGRSSEKSSKINESPFLFECLEENIQRDLKKEKTINVQAHDRKVGGRKPLSSKLPRVERIIDLSNEEKHCKKCGNLMEKIGKDVTERADIIPPKIVVEKCIRPRCVCRKCNTSPVAKDLPYVLPHSIAGNGMFSYIVTSKFCDGLPFHRLSGILSRYGIDYPKANMCNNIIQFYEQYGEKIEYILEKQIIKENLLHIDETTLQVLKEENRHNKTKSYVWVYLSSGNKKAILYSYRQTRKSDFLYDIVKKYRGIIITDGYSGYDKIFKGLPITHAGCNAHARRYFVEALETGHYLEAKVPLKIYTQLYEIEATARENGYTLDQLFSLRQEKSKLLMEKLREWVYQKRLNVSKKNSLGKAISYTINQWPKLTQFLSNPQIPIDNNAAENAIRPFVIGRKNWLFSGSPRGAESSCIFYSLIETAKSNGHDPFWYLKYLFNELPYARNNNDIEKLMPYNLHPIVGRHLDSS